jgi:hypothetical protein
MSLSSKHFDPTLVIRLSGVRWGRIKGRIEGRIKHHVPADQTISGSDRVAYFAESFPRGKRCIRPAPTSPTRISYEGSDPADPQPLCGKRSFAFTNKVNTR